MPTRIISLLLGVLLIACGSARAAIDAVEIGSIGRDLTAITLEPCAVSGVAEEALCGTYEVPEDRERQSGRVIGLKVVVLPALGPTAAPDPLFYLAGGPGEAATQAAPFFADGWEELRHHHDIVLVDQRGTGDSNPLTCRIREVNESVQALYAVAFPERALRECRAALEDDADLRLYTTPIAMDDLDEVRAALGYATINLYGGSYGTRAAFVYMRQYPENVRSVVLRAVAPVDMKALLPAARHGQIAMDGLIEDCHRDETCRSAYPQLRQDLERVISQLQDEPVHVDARDPATGEAVGVQITRDVFAGALWWLMADPHGSSQVPHLIRAAATGDFSLFVAATAPFAVGATSSWALGMALTVLCSEDVAQIDRREIAAASVETFMGEGRVQNLLRTCESWPAGRVPPGYGVPVQFDGPVLMISGEYDPIDGLDLALQAERHLPNSLHLVIPSGTHQPQFPGCLRELAIEFLRRGSHEGLDPSCVEEIRRPPWSDPRR
jgi:pimeloyl-ACP methyl ester carboxylesterase